MNKTNFFEYVAPEMELIPVVVEKGICTSPGGIEDSPENDFGDF